MAFFLLVNVYRDSGVFRKKRTDFLSVTAKKSFTKTNNQSGKFLFD